MTPKKRNYTRPIMYAIITGLHLAAILIFRFDNEQRIAAREEQSTDIMKMADLQIREREPEKPTPPPEKEPVITQPDEAERVIETEEPVSLPQAPQPSTVPAGPVEPDWGSFLAMHKVSQVPVLPEGSLKKRIRYPEIARMAGIEGLVILELFIDATGKILRINVLKEEPAGKGFAESAVHSFEGIACEPAKANGTPVAVRYRYPLRFTLN